MPTEINWKTKEPKFNLIVNVCAGCLIFTLQRTLRRLRSSARAGLTLQLYGWLMLVDGMLVC